MRKVIIVGSSRNDGDTLKLIKEIVKQTIGHGGTNDGVKTEMFCNLSKDIGVILFSNTGRVSVTDIYDELLNYGELIRKSID
jgi:hypothetical protein